VWTICAGEPPSEPLSSFAQELHWRWGVGSDAILARRSEDAVSCAHLAARYLHFSIPDCIYRRSPHTGEPLYASEAAIFGAVHPDEAVLVEELTQLLERQLHENIKIPQIQLVCPLTLGGHVDHRLTRTAAERLGIPLYYYPDYPYTIENAATIASNLPASWEMSVYPISEAGVQAWVKSIAAHRSQISTFWAGVEAMECAIREYAQEYGGVRLWRPPHPRDGQVQGT
jgi:hypothetical protein